MSENEHKLSNPRNTERRFNPLTRIGTFLLWIGVILLGIGGYVSASTFKVEQEAFAQATAIALSSGQTPSEQMRAEQIPSLGVTSTPAPGAGSSPDQGPSMLVVTNTQVVSAPSVSRLDRTENQSRSLQDRLSPRPTPKPTSKPRVFLPPDRIVINSIGLDSPVVRVGWHTLALGNTDYKVWDVADHAVGWHNTSAYPDQGGNVVLSGHNNIRGEVFRDLIKVEIGERVLVYTGQQVYLYQVVEKHLLLEQNQPLEVRRENARWIAPGRDERLTMVTCWPYSGNSHRLIVVARPISSIDAGSLEK